MYTMMQVCRETNLTYQALKYYCNEGLIPYVKRDDNNRRIFDEKDVKWIKDLVCLKKCGMSIQEMKEYLDLCLKGESTIPQRKKCLRQSRKLSEPPLRNWKTAWHTLTGSRDFMMRCFPEIVPMSAI